MDKNFSILLSNKTPSVEITTPVSVSVASSVSSPSSISMEKISTEKISNESMEQVKSNVVLGNNPTLYEALNHQPNIDAGHEPDLSIYRDSTEPIHGIYRFRSKFTGQVLCSNNYFLTNEMEIAYTQRGDLGPLVLMLHGVPTNRRQYFPIQRRLAPFCRTITIDMLGMGESTKPRNYGLNQNDIAGINQPWDWIFDTDYVESLMQELYPGEQFYFIADDWGAGISTHYAAKYPNRLLGLINIDPIAFDGYPVSEIQAIGRASEIPVLNAPEMNDYKFKEIMGSFDQTMVQILKSMVKKSEVFNQYNLRDFKFPYIDVDYERNIMGNYANSLTLELKWEAIRVLADRASILAPVLLQPYDSDLNPRGVRFENITVPVAILWGQCDNMMPSQQLYRYLWALKNASVSLIPIPDAGHLAALDQPDYVAEAILNFIIEKSGREEIADIFLGFSGIWKGDEKELIQDLRKIYNK